MTGMTRRRCVAVRCGDVPECNFWICRTGPVERTSHRPVGLDRQSGIKSVSNVNRMTCSKQDSMITDCYNNDCYMTPGRSLAVVTQLAAHGYRAVVQRGRPCEYLSDSSIRSPSADHSPDGSDPLRSFAFEHARTGVEHSPALYEMRDEMRFPPRSPRRGQRQSHSHRYS